jgi:glycosyltransferase involved in cell wall biosynthesis
MNEPYVSAIMPTAGRYAFATEAIECFRAQTWLHKELIVVDDAFRPSFRHQPADVVYHKVPPMTIGAKRNLACAHARGDIIIHWDDDDFSEPGRIADQVQRLGDSGAEVTGYSKVVFTDGATRWLYTSHDKYAIGSSLCYWRRIWESKPFAERNVGEDGEFIAGRRVLGVDANGLLTIRVHPGQTNQTAPMIVAALRRGSKQWSRI